MIFCPNCGTQVNDNVAFCPSCGANLKNDNAASATVTQPVYNEPQKKERALNTPQLVWAIINIILCCMPLGVGALILTIMAKDAADDATEQKHLKNAKICNIIGTVIGVVVFFFSFLLGLFIGFMEAGLL